jgi:hypothetical protein
VIAASAELICAPLEERSTTVNDAMSLTKSSAPAAVPPSTAAPPTASAAPPPDLQALRAAAPTVHLRFREAVQRDLRGHVARVQLYLEDGRTVKILLEHVMERVAGAYERWGEAVARLAVGGSGWQVEVDVLSPARLKEVLRDVAGDVEGGVPGYGRP